MSDIVQVSFDSPADAGRAFKLALSGRDAEQRESVLALIRQNPTAALAVLGNADSDLGLSPRQSSDALDLIVETVGTDSQSKSLLTDYLSAERTAELLTGRGDLPSSAAFVIDADALILAIVKDVTSDTGHPLLEKEEGAELEEGDVEDTSPGGEDDEEPRNAAPAYQEEAQTVEDDDSRLTPEYRRDTADRLCRWAYKIKDRPDYGDICSRVIGTFSLREWILFAIATNHEVDVHKSTMLELGIDPQEGTTELEHLLLRVEEEATPSLTLAHATDFAAAVAASRQTASKRLPETDAVAVAARLKQGVGF